MTASHNKWTRHETKTLRNTWPKFLIKFNKKNDLDVFYLAPIKHFYNQSLLDVFDLRHDPQ